MTRKLNPQLTDEAMHLPSTGDMLERVVRKRFPSQINGHESTERPVMDDHDKQTDYETYIQDTFSDLVEAGADPEMLRNLMDSAVFHAMHVGRVASIQNTTAVRRVAGGGR